MRLIVTNSIKHYYLVWLIVINSVKQFLAIMYIYGLECPYKAFVLYLNSFLKYYSLFIDFCKVYSSNLYFTPTFLPGVLNQHNFLDTIPSYLTTICAFILI